jgi:hypothetical protein
LKNSKIITMRENIMNLSRLKAVGLFAALIFVSSVSVGQADGLQEVIADFQPLDGVVVQKSGSDFLIDLDAAKGVHVGDLFSVMRPGEKIVQPLTREVIGTLDEVKAVLKVTRVKTGYSQATVITADAPIQPGNPLRRYVGIPARFWDYAGTGEIVSARLKNALPDLEWVSYTLAQQKKPASPGPLAGLQGLVFVWDAEGLSVRDSTFEIIHFYPHRQLTPAVSGSSAVTPPETPGIVQIVENAAPVAGIVAVPSASRDELVYGPEMRGRAAGVAVGDFDGDGKNEVATALDSRVALGRFVDGRYQEEGSLEVGDDYRILTLDCADLDKDGRAELYMTAVEKKIAQEVDRVASLVAEEIDGRLQVVQRDIPYLLGTVDVPGEGRLLLGQRSGENGRSYSGNLYRFERQGNRIEKGGEFSRPTDKVSVHGLTLTTDQAKRPLFVFLDINERLNVYTAGGDKVWASSDVVGGSESYIKQVDPSPREIEALVAFLKAPLGQTAAGLVLVPENEGASRIFKSREYTKSSLKAYGWDGRSLREVWHTDTQGGALADFSVADVDNDGKDEVTLAMIFSHGSITNPEESRSALVVYELP